MILKKDFYFVQHGQTDHNILDLEERNEKEHPEDIPLNQTGRDQALAIAPLITSLPIQTICVSPLKRAQETKVIIASSLEAPHHDIHDLKECSMKIWQEMRRLGMYSPVPESGEARLFIDQVRKGINQALLLPGPPLIVAHGGVHWAACCLLGIEEHEWAIDNCAVIHFAVDKGGKWVASKLT